MTVPVWGTVQAEITEVVGRTAFTVRDVLTQLADLQPLLNKVTPEDHENPVAAFNHLYWTITATIHEHLEAGYFQDANFLTVLDVEFAKRYFVALQRWGGSAQDTPHAWSVLFRQLRNLGIRSLPAAVAGVNAHVNYDLPFALVATWARLGSGPATPGQHEDYLHVNEIFYENIPQLRHGFLKAWQRVIDAIDGPLEDWYEDRAVRIARDLAWSDAERIWAIRDDPAAVERARISLDHHAALIGWVLLSPICELLQ